MNTLTIPSTDARFPTALRAVAKTPKMLYARGNLAPLHKTVVAIVGTRTPSPHALALTEQATLALGKAGFVIVTGGARGVDSRALQTALAHGFPVVCVVGNGF